MVFPTPTIVILTPITDALKVHFPYYCCCPSSYAVAPKYMCPIMVLECKQNEAFERYTSDGKRYHRYMSDGESIALRLMTNDHGSHRYTSNVERIMRRFMMKCHSSQMGNQFNDERLVVTVLKQIITDEQEQLHVMKNFYVAFLST